MFGHIFHFKWVSLIIFVSNNPNIGHVSTFLGIQMLLHKFWIQLIQLPSYFILFSPLTSPKSLLFASVAWFPDTMAAQTSWLEIDILLLKLIFWKKNHGVWIKMFGTRFTYPCSSRQNWLHAFAQQRSRHRRLRRFSVHCFIFFSLIYYNCIVYVKL